MKILKLITCTDGPDADVAGFACIPDADDVGWADVDARAAANWSGVIRERQEFAWLLEPGISTSSIASRDSTEPEQVQIQNWLTRTT